MTKYLVLVTGISFWVLALVCEIAAAIHGQLVITLVCVALSFATLPLAMWSLIKLTSILGPKVEAWWESLP